MPVDAHTTSSLAKLSFSQKERLAYIEMRVYFLGLLRRVDIEARFGIASAAATRDLAIYKELAPNNLFYDPVQRFYNPSSSFIPVFELENDRVLTWLLHGFGDGLRGPKRVIPCDGPISLVNPDLHSLALITRAIHLGQIIRIQYLSLKSGPANRDVVPLALIDNGQRWHIRCFDRKSNSFRDFVLTRMIKIHVLDEFACDNEKLSADEQWQRIVDIELVPHPKLTWPQAVVADYSMKNNQLKFKVRAATVGYMLRRWMVDCSIDANLSPYEYHLWLRNNQTLYGVESATLAPGYTQQHESSIKVLV